MFRKGLSFKGAALFISALLVTAFVFTGCNNPTGDNPAGDTINNNYYVNDPVKVPVALKGSWISEYAEEYIITGATFTSKYAGAVSYAGTIVELEAEDSTSGHMTIKYTTNIITPAAVGKYYVIAWKTLTSGTVTIAGSSNGSGYATQEEVGAEYATAIGAAPFAYGSTLSRTTVTSQPTPIMGTWNGYSTFISDKVVSFTSDYTNFYVGEIVHVRQLADDVNYITFKWIAHPTTSLIGKYSVLRWANFDDGDGKADIAVAYTTSPYDEGQASQSAAETVYISTSGSYHLTDGDLTTAARD